MLKRTVALGLLALAIFPLDALSAPDSKLSPRVRRVQRVLTPSLQAAGSQAEALPPHLSGAVEGLPAGGFASAQGSDPIVRLLILTDDPGALRQAGFEVRTVAGRVVTSKAPVSRLPELEKVPGVQFVELPMPVKAMLDVSLPEVNAVAAHGSSSPPYPMGGVTGQGVVMGIIDSGVDYTHEDFKDEGGTNRITNIWDQNDPQGPTPGGGLNYGSNWTSTEINAGTAREKDFDGHGTHVSGIAAGNGRGTGGSQPAFSYTGVAPEAELMVVATNFQEDGILDGVSYIQGRAGSKPCVINMSLGGQFGGHDGRNLLDLGLNALSGPGRILVAAAGNEGFQDLHAEVFISPTTTTNIPLLVDTYPPQGGFDNDVIIIEGWSEPGAPMQVSLISPNSIVVGPVTPGTFTSVKTDDGQVYIELNQQSGTGDRWFEINIWDSGQTQANPPEEGVWQVRVENTSSSSPLPEPSATFEVDLWVPLSTLFGFVSWDNFVDDEEMTATPATADSVIAVGAYVTKVSWPSISGGNCFYQSPPAIGDIAPFSSSGPRRDHVEKPQISAPGMGIASSKGTDAQNPSFTSECATVLDGVHVTSQGTSQACPHVSGAIALILQNNPQESYQEITQRLISTAVTDQFTAPGVFGAAAFNPEFGHGKLDVKAAVDHELVPVRLLSLFAAWESGQAVVRWELSETEPGTEFVVQRSASEDGPFRTVSDRLTGDLSFSFTDPEPLEAELFYRVSARRRDGGLEIFGPVRLEIGAGRVALLQNAPNPFTSATMISFELATEQKISLDIVDVRGRIVRNLSAGRTPAGRQEIQWNGADDAGRQAPAGVYFYRLRTESQVLVKRLVLAG